MGALFKSMSVAKKVNDIEKAKQRLENDINELEPKLKLLDQERKQMLIKYNKLSTGVLTLTSELASLVRRLRHLKSAKPNSGYTLTDDTDYD